jgi:hypothetical protein
MSVASKSPLISADGENKNLISIRRYSNSFIAKDETYDCEKTFILSIEKE